MLSEVIPWLNENGLRSYPFLTNTYKTANTTYVLPNNLILDLTITYFAAPVATTVSLSTIVNNGTTTTFNFSDSIVFSIPNSATGINYVRGTNNSCIVIDAGYLSGISENTHTFTNLYIEPSLVYEYYSDWKGVTSLSFLPNFETGSGYYPTLPLVTESSAELTGTLTFYEGYNFGLDFDTINNNINMVVGSSYGIPMTCSDYFIDPTLTDCEHIISYINGVEPNDSGLLTLAPGNNIVVLPGADAGTFYDTINISEPANAHSLFIGMSLYSTELCPAQNLLPSS